MKKILILLLILTINGCSKPKTVLICGDHICINKDEAKQYFEDNLSLEVQIIDNDKSKQINLVELNLKPNEDDKKIIKVFSKKTTEKDIVKLSNKEIKEKKIQLKERKKLKSSKIKILENRKKNKAKKKKIVKKTKTKSTIKQTKNEILDVCTILEKCNIEEISKFLTKQGKDKKFPDITTRE
mgnify:FL=1|jgi:hypothetical protein